MLYLVPTPIGNLDDITYRAIKVLNEVDVIYAEDTRTSGVLLKHYDIKKEIRAYHSFNEHKIVNQIVSQIKIGQTIALITDAGTPAISDPGFLLVRACKKDGLKVSCLPGATAFVPALAASGLPSDSFYFYGFLPHKKGRHTALTKLAELEETFILYESTHRLVRCLEELTTYCGEDRQACVCREISKIHEEINSNSLYLLLNHYKSHIGKGEIVIVVEGKSKKKIKKEKKDEEE